MIETGGWGGIGHYAHCLCSAISAAGATVTLLTHADRYQLEKLPKNYDCRKLFTGNGFVADWLRLQTALSEESPDVVHFQSLLSTRRDWIVFLLYKHLRKGPMLVYTVHNVLPHEIACGERMAYKMLYRNASGLILHSHASVKKMSQLLNGDIPAAHEVIPHGHYGALVAAGEQTFADSLALMNLQPADYIVFFGAIRPYKGLDRLLRAVARVDHWPPELKLLVVGHPMHGVSESDIIEWVRQLDIADRVVLRLGYVPEDRIPAVFNIAALVALPYLEIDQSGVLMAALAAGKPVLCTPVGAFPDVVRPEFGFLTAGCTEDLLADTLRVAIDKRGRWVEMGSAAKKTAEATYAWSEIAEQTLGFYDRLNLRADGICRNGNGN